MLNKKIVREYDIRGIYNKDLFAENGYEIGLALGTIALNAGSNIVNIAYDGRLSSPEISENLIKGVLETGCSVNDLGLLSSPALYFSIYHLAVDYGVIITASHNPKEYNGFKFISTKQDFYGKALQEFANFVNAGEFTAGQGSLYKKDIKEAYITKLLAEIEDGGKKLRVAWDPACGAGAEICDILTERLNKKENLDNFIINEKIDGTFPAHDPDPTIEGNLQQLKDLVSEHNCDLGVAFDGDADRVGVIDDEGVVLWGDQLVTFFAKDILAQNPPNKKILADVKASKIFVKKVTEYGGEPLIWKTGHSLIKAKMKETGAMLAGEMSGHIFFKDGDNHGYDDGIYAAVRLIRILQKSEIKLSDFRKSLPKTFATIETKISCSDEIKFQKIEELKNILKKQNIEFIDIDGVRVESEKGWWLIRASNTSPYLTTRCEGNSESNKEILKAEVFKMASLLGL